jgi:hypothetical protein
MGALRILTVCLAGWGFLFLPDGFATAAESRAVKPETLLVQGKSQDFNGANGETKSETRASFPQTDLPSPFLNSMGKMAHR